MVDGHQVNLATVEQLLSTFTSSSAKVRLTLHRPPPQQVQQQQVVPAVSPLDQSSSLSSGREEEEEEEVSAITNITEEGGDGDGDDTPSSLFVSTPPRLARCESRHVMETLAFPYYFAFNFFLKYFSRLLLGDDSDGDASREVRGLLRRMPYLVLGVKRETEEGEGDSMSDVLYQFPPPGGNDGGGGPLSEAILKARGIFTTLCQVRLAKKKT